MLCGFASSGPSILRIQFSNSRTDFVLCQYRALRGEPREGWVCALVTAFYAQQEAAPPSPERAA
jgi:hypothetical protein